MESENEKISILYNKIKNFITELSNEKDFNQLSYWLSIGVILAELVDKYDDISGLEKKNMVLKVIELILDDENILPDMDKEKRNNIKQLIQISLPPSIDLIIKATKGEIKINKKKECNFLCFNIKSD